MMIDLVTGGGWWRIFRFEGLTHPCACNSVDNKNLSLPVTCHLLMTRSRWLGAAYIGGSILNFLGCYWWGAEA
jgi:hypothetical protein